MKKLLVTGGLGHIGSKLIRDYADRKDLELIRIFDDFSTQRYPSIFNLPKDMRYEFLEGNILDKKRIEEAVQGIDVMIHLAAITDAPSTINRPEETFKVNLEGTRNVLEAASNSKIATFLFPSTTSVYGEAEGIVDETCMDCKPSSPYASAKFQAEKEVSSFGRNNLDTKVLRLGTIFGVSPGMRFHTAINKFCYQAAMNLPLTVWENAYHQKRPYAGLSDAVRAFQHFENNGKSGEVYNILTNNFSVKEIVDFIKEVVPDLNVNFTKSPILNQKSYAVSCKKAEDVGYLPRDEIRNDIFQTIDLFRAIKNKG